MLIEERLERIKKIIKRDKNVSIEQLVRALHVSKDTIRRDLMKLEAQNILRRTHGGAVWNTREALIFSYDQRLHQHQLIKEKIAQKALTIIKDNCSVLLDSSTTVEAVVAQLGNKAIYGITNSLIHAQLLAKNQHSEITVLPGKLNKDQLFLYGSETIKSIEQYTVDYTLLGVFALSKKGLFIHTEEEGLVKRQMVAQASKVIALADHTKIDTMGFFKVCELTAIDYLITDVQPEETLLQALKKHNIELILIDSEKGENSK